MKTNEYKGQLLRLVYPAFLKVKSAEPNWSAMGPRKASTVCVEIDPAPSIVKAHTDMIQSPHFQGGPGLHAEIIREGQFRTPKGLEGFQRVVKLTNGIGQVFWGWGAVGMTPNKHSIVVDIGVQDENWQNGEMWQELLNSIEVLTEQD